MDILTTRTTHTALDVSVCSPHAHGAGLDCTRFVGAHIPAPGRENDQIVRSASGRPHPDTLTVLRTRSKRISRRRDVASEAAVYQRLDAHIALVNLRRALVRARAPLVCRLLHWLFHLALLSVRALRLGLASRLSPPPPPPRVASACRPPRSELF